LLIIKSYLKDRYFSVRSGTVLFPITEIKAGVPQEAVIAPMLFNLYITDQPATPNTIVEDFADDKTFLATHSDPQISAQYIRVHLGHPYLWYNE